MPPMLSAKQFLDRDFLQMRCRVLDVAAALDRMTGAADADAAATDPRIARLHAALAVLLDGEGDRARRVQMVFSDEYDPGWK